MAAREQALVLEEPLVVVVREQARFFSLPELEEEARALRQAQRGPQVQGEEREQAAMLLWEQRGEP